MAHWCVFWPTYSFKAQRNKIYHTLDTHQQSQFFDGFVNNKKKSIKQFKKKNISRLSPLIWMWEDLRKCWLLLVQTGASTGDCWGYCLLCLLCSAVSPFRPHVKVWLLLFAWLFSELFKKCVSVLSVCCMFYFILEKCFAVVKKKTPS